MSLHTHNFKCLHVCMLAHTICTVARCQWIDCLVTINYSLYGLAGRPKDRVSLSARLKQQMALCCWFCLLKEHCAYISLAIKKNIYIYINEKSTFVTFFVVFLSSPTIFHIPSSLFTHYSSKWLILRWWIIMV